MEQSPQRFIIGLLLVFVFAVLLGTWPIVMGGVVCGISAYKVAEVIVDGHW